MNLEKDSAPTGLYNYLPKLGRRSRRRASLRRRLSTRRRRPVKFRSTIKYGRKKSS